jgi:hypothetical protein
MREGGNELGEGERKVGMEKERCNFEKKQFN